jgi:nicotinamidase-related amidase
MNQADTLVAEETVLLVVDVQERFRPAITDFESVLAGCVRLVRAFRAMELPIIVTEQYPRGLGPTVEELRAVLSAGESSEGGGQSAGGAGPASEILEKTSFSVCGAGGFSERLSSLNTPTVLVCGIETHVCVQQSVHDLLSRGLAVQVAVDAIGSRKDSDRTVALRRMEKAGAILTTTEMAAFELLRDAKHPKFKDIQALFK